MLRRGRCGFRDHCPQSGAHLYRLEPQLRTPDEHPLRMADFQLAKRFFSSIELSFFGLSTLLAVPFRETKVGAPAMKLCEAADSYLLRVPLIQRNAWFVLMQLTR